MPIQQNFSMQLARPIENVDNLVGAIQRGDISQANIPLDYVFIDGQKLILDIRSSTALTSMKHQRLKAQ